MQQLALSAAQEHQCKLGGGESHSITSGFLSLFMKSAERQVVSEGEGVNILVSQRAVSVTYAY